jgi:plastocyanin
LASPSGNGQYGVVGAQLAQPLRIVVTRSGAPAAGEAVQFQTAAGGSFAPTQVTTDAQGIASSMWTLGASVGAQQGSATIGTASTTLVAAAASAGAASEIEVRTSGGSRFVPAALTVPAGTTVRWRWLDDSHTVTSSGAPAFPGSTAISATPQIYEYTFATPGTYTYYCAVHGTPGSGMRGTVVVE